MRLLRPLLLFVALWGLLAPAPARAWFNTGHMVCASLAYQSLSPAARARVDFLLTKSPSYADWQKTMPTGYVDTGRYFFMRASTWPDDIRKTPEDRPSWHYIDYPVLVSGAGFAPDPTTLQPPSPNAQTQIVAETAVLSSTTASDTEKAIALCWIAHLIGDIHQPLHTASLYSALLPQGDRGGNSIDLAGALYVDKRNGKLSPVNLHGYWDGLFGDTDSPLAVDRIVAGLSPLARKDLPELTKHPNVADWVADSSALARQYAYLNGTLVQTANPPDPDHPDQHTTTATLPAGYLTQANKIADRQIALAGFRLADTLNSALK